LAITAWSTVATLSAQTPENAIKVFAPVYINNSLQKPAPNSYGTNTISLTCPAGAPVQASVSSTPDGTGYLLEDNLLYVNNVTFPTLTPPDGGDQGVNGGVNVCRAGDTSSPGNATATNCFQQAYESEANSLIGQNPDTISDPANFLSTYGVPPIDVSSYIQAGQVQNLKFDLIDFGGLLGTSTLYLVTNCSQNGVTSGGTITGNPIPSTNPPPDLLTQTFPFDSTTDQLVKFTSDFSKANTAGTLSIVNNSLPSVLDTLVTPAQYSTLVAGTSLAPSLCIPLSGELDSNGNPECKLFTITCTNDNSNTSLGTNCPQSTARNLLLSSKFDADATFVQGLQPGTGYGLLMGSDSWTGSPCAFMPNTPDANLLCPQNLSTEFLGDFGTGGTGKSLNSSFIVVRDVPLPVTNVTVTPMSSYGWTNSSTPSVQFVSNIATYSGPNPLNGFIAAPITSLTYGVVDPVPDTTLPVSGDTTLTNSTPCPSTPTTGATSFTSNAVLGPLTDGTHSLHYFATDCAATEELLYTVQPGNQGNWASFKVQPINVDTQSPSAAFNGSVAPINNVVLNSSPVNLGFQCGDSGSGLAVCGVNPSQTLGSTGIPSFTGSVTVPTNTLGSSSYTVYARDLAGNAANTSTVTYNVQYAGSGFCFIEPGHQILLPIYPNGTAVFKQGWNVLARFRVCDAKGNSISTSGTVKNVSVQRVAGAGALNTLNTDPFSDSGFHWDPILREWEWNISTKGLVSGSTYKYTVTLKDNSLITFQFGVH
jgi:hypothetical protein